MDYFTADLHFGHERILSICKRPWASAKEMNEGLIALFNEVVTPEDTTYFLGDISFISRSETRYLLSRLHGRKILVIGNHDTRSSLAWWKGSFDEVYDPRQGQVIPYNQDIVMSHLPWREDLSIYDHRARLLPDACPRCHEVTLLHGHVHRMWAQQGNQINVGVDVRGYRPISIETIQTLISLTNE